MRLRKIFIVAVVLWAGLIESPSRAAVITAGTPITTVPDFLSDGSYLFGITVTLAADQFLLPVGITGAIKLQHWQFDLAFDNTVVQVVEPFDGTSGIYGAQFVPSDASSLSFILGGFPFNDLGLVDDVAGSYPNLIDGPSGDGVLAYVLFEFRPDQQDNNPGFRVDDPIVTQAPEPGTLALLAAVLAGVGVRRAVMRRRTLRPMA